MAVEGGTQMNGLLEPGYRAFLLRCWPEVGAGPDPEPDWRFALVQPGDQGSGRAFANLEALVAFLREELGRGSNRHSLWRQEMNRFV